MNTALGNMWGQLSSHSSLKERINIGKMFASAEESSRKRDARREGASPPPLFAESSAVLFSWCSCYGFFTSPGASHVCFCLCSRSCPGPLPALPVSQQGCHGISQCPDQEMQLLALLCSKVILFFLSPGENCIAMLCKQLMCTKDCFPHMVQAKCEDDM